MKKNNNTGRFDNIEQHLHIYAKTQDEKLFNATVYPYLQYLALWEMGNWNTSTYCHDKNELKNDLVTAAVLYLPMFKEGHKCTAQSWCRLAMKCHLRDLYKKSRKMKRDVRKTISLDYLLEEGFDLSSESPEDKPDTVDLLKKFDNAVKVMPLFDNRMEEVYNVVRQAIEDGERFYADIPYNKKRMQHTCHIARKWNSDLSAQVKQNRVNRFINTINEIIAHKKIIPNRKIIPNVSSTATDQERLQVYMAYHNRQISADSWNVSKK
jgi:hypothetical protein